MGRGSSYIFSSVSCLTDRCLISPHKHFFFLKIAFGCNYNSVRSIITLLWGFNLTQHSHRCSGSSNTELVQLKGEKKQCTIFSSCAKEQSHHFSATVKTSSYGRMVVKSMIQAYPRKCFFSIEKEKGSRQQ